MAQIKKILVSLPDTLLEEVDDVVNRGDMNRSEFVREAMKFYLKERKRRDIHERMKQGYLEMGNLNLQIAEDCLRADNEQQCTYEEFISESE